MILKIKHFVAIVTIGLLTACQSKPQSLSEIEARQLPISDSITTDATIEAFVLPYRQRIDAVLDSTLAIAAKPISKEDGYYNTTAGNLMADIVLEQANPIFKKRTGEDIDFVLLNHGGIRAVISKGPVSARTAYEVMPFENSIAVVELSGQSVLAMIDYLIASKRAHPISGIQVVLTKSGELHSLSIAGKAFDVNKHYWVATSDYLTKGGDSMVFFKDALNITTVDYLIRNALIDYFKKVDTLSPVIDDRFYKME